MSLLEDARIMLQVHEEYPRKEEYTQAPYDGLHGCWDNSRVVYCDGERDIRRCELCGDEWECSCNIDDDFS